MKPLNLSQQRAVDHMAGPLLILAGAGSGKTRVLIERIARIIVSGVALPQQIVAVTFTNKAASQLKERLNCLLQTVHRFDATRLPARALWIGTFHGSCVRLLAREGSRLPAPYRPGFSIFDKADQERTLKDIYLAKKIDPDSLPINSVLQAISRAKNHGFAPEDLAQAARSLPEEANAELFGYYQQRLERQNALDFDDLLGVTARLFAECPAALAHWQQYFRHILVDEYQDTNQAQYRILRLLAGRHRNLTVVGDVDQSIYSFRAADFRIILQFEQDYPDATRITLEENYRSLQPILDLANGLIAHNTLRYTKVLKPVRQGYQPIVLYCAADEREEAHWVIDQISELALPYDAVAILYRTNAQSRSFEEALGSRGMPYRLIGGLRFFERREIKDLLAYLRLLLNPYDDAAFCRIANVPKRGIGNTTLQRLKDNAANRGMALLPFIAAGYLAGIRPVTASKLSALADFLRETAEPSVGRTPLKLLQEVVDKTNYLDYLIAEDPVAGIGRVENVHGLIAQARELEESGEVYTLAEFLASSALQGAEDQPQIKGATAANGQVTLMTLHSAKGLEFPVVFLVGLEEGIFPHQYSVTDPLALEEERR
ncbi:MAG: UvrD-helicase domain-containing protein, partial [Cyanobacteria bacterium NC_groundwater_1444_Ag_S-0.65um_54_12]|nr:UvrD-helicase domain-containing protein [Cyanobacteria bacterium NC_groundwater_1444_Ag_S-0.65um_54_12]